MDWDAIFYWYIVLVGLLGWFMVKAIKRGLGQFWVLRFGFTAMLISLFFFLWRRDLFVHANHPGEPGLMRFILYPILLFGLITCRDWLEHYIPRLFQKDREENA